MCQYLCYTCCMLNNMQNDMPNKEDNLINIGIKEGDDIFFKILNQYPELDDKDLRRGAVLLSLMTNAVVQLHASGWSEQALVNEVFDHCKIAQDIMNEDEE